RRGDRAGRPSPPHSGAGRRRGRVRRPGISEKDGEEVPPPGLKGSTSFIQRASASLERESKGAPPSGSPPRAAGQPAGEAGRTRSPRHDGGLHVRAGRRTARVRQGGRGARRCRGRTQSPRCDNQHHEGRRRGTVDEGRGLGGGPEEAGSEGHVVVSGICWPKALRPEAILTNCRQPPECYNRGRGDG
ncbi:hypothetical protein THAOC_20405, partial [Thalassiosira oceanica]